VDHLIERRPIYPLHRVVQSSQTFARRVNSNDVAVAETSGSFDFALKTRSGAFREMKMKRQHFQSDGPVQRDLLSAIDKAHTAGADLPFDEKVADLAAGAKLDPFV